MSKRAGRTARGSLFLASPIDYPVNIARWPMADTMPIHSCAAMCSHYGSLPDGAQDPAAVMVSTACRLICGSRSSPLPVCALLDGREGILHPYPPFFRIACQCLADRPLGGETEHLKSLADVLHRVVDPEFPADELRAIFLVHWPKSNCTWRRFPGGHLYSFSCSSVSSLFRPDAIFVNRAARPPSRNFLCHSWTEDSATSRIFGTSVLMACVDREP